MGQRAPAAGGALGGALAQSLTGAWRAGSVIPAGPLGDIVAGPGRADTLATPAGLPLADMTGDQLRLAAKLIEEYAHNMRSELAEQELRRMTEAGSDRVHFAWAGPLEPGRAHYYRLPGPPLLTEHDNTQNNADHIHSVWHDPPRDFGQDLLRAHYERGHHHDHA